MSPSDPARWVLRQFPGVTADVPEFLGNRGGFSGARLWKATALDGPVCLRAWPKHVTPAHLHFIHGEMLRARAQGLDFVPKVYQTSSSATWVQHVDRLWDVTTWMPGVADFASHPSQARLENVSAALARLHLAWGQPAGRAVCPAVLRRLARWQSWRQIVLSGWRPTVPVVQAPLDDCLRRAWGILPPLLESLPSHLQPWLESELPVQSCLGDVWHDHLLFVGDAVGGIIDYGQVRGDHVAVDLARMFGSLVGDDAVRFSVGLAAYRRLRPLSLEEEELTHLLDRTGTLLGAASWLIWLCHDKRRFEDAEAVARRLGTLVARIEGWE